jgi:hypothetical protein
MTCTVSTTPHPLLVRMSGFCHGMCGLVAALPPAIHACVS